MDNVLVIGAGYMGSALARYLNKHDMNVFLYDQSVEQLNRLQNDETLVGIHVINRFDEIESLDFIIEAIPENLSWKQKLFQEIDEVFDENVIYCTNTSSYLISEIGLLMKTSHRLIGMHFFSPADITPLVEVIPSSMTSTKTKKHTMTFLRQIGKKPVLLEKEIEGFVANRLQSALAREAMSLVEKGIVSAAGLDYIAKWSLGIRLANTGPLEQRDLNGIDTHYHVAKYVYPSLENATEPLAIHTSKIANEQLGMKSSKGFYDWTQTDKAQYVIKKETKLKKIIKIIEQENEEGNEC